MAIRVGLNAYRVKFYNNAASRYISFSKSTNDPYSLMANYIDSQVGDIKTLASHVDPDDLKERERRAIQWEPPSKSATARVISGIIRCGEYGLELPVFDINKKKKTKTKERLEAEQAPFYYRLYMPIGSTAGIALFTKLGRSSIKSAAQKDINVFLRDHNIRMHLETLTDRQAFFDYLSLGDITCFHAVAEKRNDESRDILERSRIGDRELGTGTKVRISVQPAGTQEKIKALVKSIYEKKAMPSDLIAIYGLPSPDEIAIDVKFENSRTKKIWVTSVDDTSFSYDVTGEISFGADGFPTFSSLEEVAKSYSDELDKFIV